MPLPLAGKTALITGAARGIGRAVAHKLAAAGCDVIANYYNSHEEAEAQTHVGGQQHVHAAAQGHRADDDGEETAEFGLPADAQDRVHNSLRT